ETTHATAVSCRRRGIKPSPPLRSLSHHPTTPARWPAALTDALPTRPAPGRSSQLDPLAKETLPESCIEQNPPAIVRQAIFRLLNESGYIYKISSGRVAIAHRGPGDVCDGRRSMVGWFEALDDWAKMLPSRDHGTSSTAAYPSMASVAGGWRSLGPLADMQR